MAQQQPQEQQNQGGSGGKKGGDQQKGPRPFLMLLHEKKDEKTLILTARLMDSHKDRYVKFTANNLTFAELGTRTANGDIREARAELKIREDWTEVHLRVETIGEPRLSYDKTLAIDDLRSIKPTERSKVLKRLHLDNESDQVYVLIARLDDSGKPDAGAVYFVYEPKKGVQKRKTKPDGTLWLEFPRGDHAQRVTIFTPEKPDEVLEIDVPRRMEKKEKEEDQEPQPSKAERRQQLFEKGRQAGDSFWGKIFGNEPKGGKK